MPDVLASLELKRRMMDLLLWGSHAYFGLIYILKGLRIGWGFSDWLVELVSVLTELFMLLALLFLL